MKSIKNIILASSILILSAFTISSSLNWTISEGYEIKFSSSTGDPEGIFKTINGDIQFNENDLASSKCDFKVDVNSINTGNGMQNKHAISAKWFDAEKYPNIAEALADGRINRRMLEGGPGFEREQGPNRNQRGPGQGQFRGR